MPKYAVIEVREPEVGSRFINVWFSREICETSVDDVIETLAIAGRMESRDDADGGGVEYVIMPPASDDEALIVSCESLRLGIRHHLGFNAHIKSMTGGFS